MDTNGDGGAAQDPAAWPWPLTEGHRLALGKIPYPSSSHQHDHDHTNPVTTLFATRAGRAEVCSKKAHGERDWVPERPSLVAGRGFPRCLVLSWQNVHHDVDHVS